MTEAMWLFLGAMISTVITSAITLYRARFNGPDTQINSLTASDKLEERVQAMEAELDQYYALYGPLPLEDENS